jgi:hypothetical protein
MRLKVFAQRLICRRLERRLQTLGANQTAFEQA